MNTDALRQAFLDYFVANGHTQVPSASLIPADDPTLLFTNAGMVPFKQNFLGTRQVGFTRATSCQRCVRAGGKHNDLDNVGFTHRHHTFFEMLGNFSFGDYFKREAIQLAWRFLTEELQLPPAKLWVTVYTEDEEAATIWLQDIGVSAARFSRCGDADNFWSMGDTGPCGPCSEIFYDHGPTVAGGPPGSAEAEGDRFVEIWNLVFMQYNRDSHGNLHPLPKPSVDTGMGLERVAAVMQGVQSNYDTDVFQALIQAAAKLAGTTNTTQPAFKVVADHLRSSAFLIADGVLPSNEGRGYVLRRIIRRGCRHGSKVGLHGDFFAKLMPTLCDKMRQAYPELSAKQADIMATLSQEAAQFAKTLDQGLKVLEQVIKTLSGGCIPGDTVFLLYDTYGFPVDLTADIARERNLTVDMAGFETAMAAQRARARGANRFSQTAPIMPQDLTTTFTGYEQLESASNIAMLGQAQGAVTTLASGATGWVVLGATPFYAEAGGQVGDRGQLRGDNWTFEVLDTQRHGQAIVHFGEVVQGTLAANDAVTAQVDASLRQATALNHSATHLLHAALRSCLGTHVTQKGSVVSAERLRFDFSHAQPVTQTQCQQIEALVNQHIRANHLVQTDIMSLQQARAKGAMALFDEKYADEVRVLTMDPDFSVELCGGTHVTRTGEIGLFKITHETGIAAGVRRIEAVTGLGAQAWLEAHLTELEGVATLLNTSVGKLAPKVEQLLTQNKALQTQVNHLQGSMLQATVTELAQNAVSIGAVQVVVGRLTLDSPKGLREMVDDLKNRLGTAIIVLGVDASPKVHLLVGVTQNCTDKVKASELIKFIAEQVGGKGGGRADFAQAGGSVPQQLPAALDSVLPWLQQRLT